MEKLGHIARPQVIDVLMERLVFERAGVRLYDRIIEVIEVSGSAAVQVMLGQLRQHREEEQEHADWLEGQVLSLGGDPHAETERARLVETLSKGIEEVVLQSDDTVIPHLLSALLAAELVDGAGWALLVDLAEKAEDHEAKQEFARRARQEEDHLTFVRTAVSRFAQNDVLGKSVELPTAP